MRHYERWLLDFANYCFSNRTVIDLDTADLNVLLPNFMAAVTKNHPRPGDSSSHISAAVNFVQPLLGPPTEEFRSRVFRAVIKTNTTAPAGHKLLFDVATVVQRLQHVYAENSLLNLDQLRRKAIFLVMAVLLARPSDVVRFRVHFPFDPSAPVPISCVNTKNDSNSVGFTRDMLPASVPAVDPVRTLHQYLSKAITLHGRPNLFDDDREIPLFFKHGRGVGEPLQPSTISTQLSALFEELGFSGDAYTAGQVRGSAATTAFKAGVDVSIIEFMGRWSPSTRLADKLGVVRGNYFQLHVPPDWSNFTLGILDGQTTLSQNSPFLATATTSPRSITTLVEGSLCN